MLLELKICYFVFNKSGKALLNLEHNPDLLESKLLRRNKLL